MSGFTLTVFAVVIVSLSCGADPEMRSESSAVSGETAQESEVLPASAAGSPSGSQPGTPADFTGAVRDSIPITQEELDAIRAGEALEAERNPAGTKPSDLGFGVVKPKPRQPQTMLSQETP